MPSPPTLVLLHAFPLTPAIYDGARADLAGVADVLTPAFRGFGDSPLGDGQPSLDLLAGDVVRLLDEHDVDQAVVGGTSMGGYVTLALLRAHPERVRAAVLANTKASADTDEARANRLRIAERVGDVGPSLALEGMVPNLLGATTKLQRPDLVAAVDGLVAGADPAAVAWAQRAMAARPDSFDALRAFERPVLVLAGEEDALMPQPEAEAMAAAAPRSTLEVLTGVGHLGSLEAPDRWSRAVGDWLGALD